ncbi:MAG: BlaI/MecI/CopY family transcriptional regulator [Oscillospiraceae bacterium]|nr:BlaI/MecI/CopY family transcriptional regulator [Oscillospiraceae bacterium]
MELKLYDSELKVMKALWQNGELRASRLAKLLNEQTGWNRNATCTVIKKLIKKGAIKRVEPGFLCRATISQEQVRRNEAVELVDKLFDHSASLFLTAYTNGKKLPSDEV